MAFTFVFETMAGESRPRPVTGRGTTIPPPHIFLAFRPECKPLGPHHGRVTRPPLPEGSGDTLADAMGPSRRSLTPTANTSPQPPRPGRGGWLDNTVGVASRK